MKLALIFLPLILHLLLRRTVRRAPVVATAVAAAASLGLMVMVIWQPPVWPQEYRIGWLGVSAKGGNRLVIGGPPENSVCGWPNEALAPAVSVAVQPDKTGLMLVEGGGAFVFVRGADGEGLWEPVNGVELKSGDERVFKDPLTHRRYVFRVRPDGWWWSSIRFRLTIAAEGPQKHILADIPLRSSGSEGNVTGLAPLLELSTATLRGALSEKIALRTWAGGFRFFVPRSREGVVRVIEPETTAKASIPLPCEMMVRWAGNSPVKAKLRLGDGSIESDFLVPWRWTSPLPPQNDSGYPKVTFCAQAQPKDYAFLLPLGRMTAAMRADRELGTDDGDKLALVEPQSASGRTLIPPHVFERRTNWRNEPTILSSTVLSAGDYGFRVGIIYDLPGFLGILGAALPAFGIFVLALWMTSARMGVVEESRAAAFGLALSVWVFLLVRLLLALRYALEPAHVDRVAVEGAVNAYLGLTAVPGVILLVARLAFLKVEPVPDDRRPRSHVPLFMVGWVLALVLTWFLAGNLWPSWRVSPLRLAGALALSVGLAAFLCGTLDCGGQSGGLRRLFTGWCRPAVARVSGRLWKRIYDEKKGMMPLILVMIFLMSFLSLLGLALTFFTTRETSEEIWIPLGCIWLPVLFWLIGQARAAEASDHAALRIPQLIGLVLLFAVVPIGLQVLLSGDAGTAFAAFAAFLPLGCLLSVMRPPRLGLAILSTLVILISTMVWLAFNAPAAFDHLGEAGVRIRSFVHGDQMQIEYLFGVGIPNDNNASGVKADKILNVSQHTWENKALAHEGGFLGMGFGEAPVRRSHVPMHTIQCDSVFSFYILSEHGLCGGFALLLASFVPFFHVVSAARPRFDAGFGLATVVTGAFAIETLTQAAMNLGYLPFTGRNLPLLAVISPTDLAKWTLLFAIATRALFLRYDRDGSLNPDAAALSAPAPSDGFSFGWLIRPLFAIGIPLTLLWLFVRVDRGRIDDKDLDKPFTWDVLDDQVVELQKKGYVTVDETKHELRYNEAPPNVRRLDLDENRLLLQEIERFNQLPIEERFSERGIEEFGQKLRTVADARNYDALMDELRKKASIRTVQARPPVFEMRFHPDPQDENERQVAKQSRFAASKDGESGEWEIRANGDFSSQLHFKRTPQEAQLPELAWEGSRHALLLGPAWVMGRSVIAYDPDAPLPWVAQLAEALRQEWDQIGPDAGSRFRRLTLSPDLQRVASNFVVRQGRAHHTTLLAAAAQRKSSDASELRERIPPRVALSILDLAPKKRGEVVALAGWPRTTSKPFWYRSNDGEWLPPAHWLEQNAPESLKRRYLGDRNFDLMLMGSASKPIFAAAALGAQPDLDRRLHTEGGEAKVHELFGVEVADVDRSWNESWHGGPGPWRNFDNYLAYSDNRYHIRLGFLALAERDGGTIAMATPVRSSIVSLDNSTSHRPWLAFPKFPQLIKFSHNSPQRMEKLNETNFARRLKAFFPVGIKTGELRPTRLSFWTGNEEDDVRQSQSGARSSRLAFNRISPQPPRLDLDSIHTPRAYIMVLLGGLTNTWSNVDFAGAFGTTVLGRPVVPHMVAGDEPSKQPAREEFVSIADRLRPGLKGVVKFGTASRGFAAGKASVLDRWTARGYEVLAKTGTLEEDNVTKRKTSRLVLALVRWNESKSDVRNGVVFSLVTEHADTGTATNWLREFIANHDAEINAFLERAE